MHLRHATTHDVLACWFGVDRSTLSAAPGCAASGRCRAPSTSRRSAMP
ncbi:transposase family protein [Streptomyces paradoxus]